MATSPNFITRATRKQALEERGLIRSQMRLGAGLIALGALSIPLFQVSGVLEGQAATAAFAVATAVIGAGAANAADWGRRTRQRPHPAVATGPGHCGRRPARQSQRPSRQRPGPNRDCSEHGSRRPATPRAAGEMPRTLCQLWADEDDAHKRELEHKQRATPSACQAGRPAPQVGRRPRQRPRDVTPRTIRRPTLRDYQATV
jgi:hypothetical protein